MKWSQFSAQPASDVRWDGFNAEINVCKRVCGVFELQLDKQFLASYCSQFINEHHMAYMVISLGK